MEPGKYLRRADRKRQERERRLRKRKYLQLLLAVTGGNALLVYLIATGNLNGTWGAALTAALSVSLGYRMKGVLL